MTYRGVDLLLDFLVARQVPFVFGNPGTTELPLNDALVADRRLRYILGLHETPVVAMADGYAMASGRLGVVNVHISCGLGNAMGMLYNAHCEGSPVLLTAGQQDRRLLLEEPVLSGDLVRVAAPWTKWSYEVRRVEELEAALRRAAQVALTPPTGPVFLSLPVDLQWESATRPERLDAGQLDTRIRPPAAAVQAAARLLLASSQPAILAGSRVVERGGCAWLAELAELLGAPVFSEAGTSHGRLPLASDHPLYAQCLPLWSPRVRQRLAPFDTLLVVGANLLRQYVFHGPSPLPEGLKLVHLDDAPAELNKNFPLDVAVWGDIGEGLRELLQCCRQQADATHLQAARGRASTWAAQHVETRRQLATQAAAERSQRPLTPLALMAAVGEVMDERVVLVEEAVTTTGMALERLGKLTVPEHYFGHRGWALGWGLGCALGVQLAWPEKRVLAVLGDGATMYGLQGLWTAAHYQIPAVILVCNNGQYQILKWCAREYKLPEAMANRYEALDLGGPAIDFVALSRGLGVDAHRVEDPDSLIDHLRQALAGNRPVLLEVPVAPSES